MGYNPGVRVYKLVFVDREGLTVRARSTDTDTFIAMSRLADLAEDADLTDDGAVKELEGLFSTFSKHLVSWNIELPVDPGDESKGVYPVPATRAGLGKLDLDFVLELVFAWLDAISSVAPPLSKTSSNGPPALEGSMPMEPLSTSPPS
jgi:hypothetical protein